LLHIPTIMSLKIPKRTECNICCIERFCLPCSAFNNCDAYCCSTCAQRIYSLNPDSTIAGLKFDCSFCKCNHGKAETVWGIDPAAEACSLAVMEGECCVMSDIRFAAWKDIRRGGKLSRMSHAELIKLVMDGEASLACLFDDFIDTRDKLKQKQRQVSELFDLARPFEWED